MTVYVLGILALSPGLSHRRIEVDFRMPTELWRHHLSGTETVFVTISRFGRNRSWGLRLVPWLR